MKENNLLQNTRIGLLRNFALLIILAGMIVAFSLTSDAFFTGSNLINVIRQISFNSISAVGMTMLILQGEIDLSIGSLVAFVGVLSTMIFKASGSIVVCIISAVAIGAGIGWINGLFTVKGRIVSFIATLATMTVMRGLAFIISGGSPIAETDPIYLAMGRGNIGGIFPIPILIMGIIIVLGTFILKKMRFGYYIYAIGGNKQASQWAGINTDKVRIIVFLLCGLFTGINAILTASRMGSGYPAAGSGLELQVIAAVILGGTSLAGGKGTIWGSLLGVLLIGILSNGLTLTDVSTYWQQVATGFIILATMLIDTFAKRKQN